MESNPLLNKVLHYVSIRPRSRKEISTYIKEKLYKKSTPEETENSIVSIMEKLEDLKLVDDEGFARSFIEWRLSGSSPKGFRIIRNELFVKGIERDLLEDLFEEEEYKEMEISAAEKMILKKSRSYKDPRELKNYLISRGFSAFAIEEALEK